MNVKKRSIDCQQYADCMEEIKHRTRILDNALAPFRNSGHSSVANCELAALQMRKIYELIAFAGISANKERYQRIRSAYEKDWNLSKIVGFISNVNPDFLPVPIYEIEGTPLEVKEKDEPRITKQQLVKRHGSLGAVLHAQSPYRRQPDYNSWFEKIASWRDESIALLNTHKVTIDDETWFRVVMKTAKDGNVQVATMSLIKDRMLDPGSSPG